MLPSFDPSEDDIHFAFVRSGLLLPYIITFRITLSVWVHQE